MSTRKVKIEDILGTQIPQFLSSESNLFQEFLKQYYISQSHETGLLDVTSNLSRYKNIETYTSGIFNLENGFDYCYLIEDVTAFETTIQVNSTEGFPDKYGLLQIDDEIITYLEKTEDSFVNCYRGFSGITAISDVPNSSGLTFTKSSANYHNSKTKVTNLNLIFYNKLFEKFKAHYFPDFEKRELSTKVGLELLLSRARDFYLTKGSDISFKILFEVLFGDSVEVFKPKEFVIRTEDKNTIVTKNILIEPLNIVIEPLSLIGKTIYQDLPSGNRASASIYNVEFRPTDDLSLYELSLDEESLIYNFNVTNTTSVHEVVDDGIIVDSTIGFPNEGEVYVKIRDINGEIQYTSFNYSGKTINKFLNIDEDMSILKEGDRIIENNLVNIDIDDTNTISFRLLNLIENFDFSESYASKVNDTLYLTNFGDNYTSRPEFNCWVYNYPIYHNIKSIDEEVNIIILYDNVKFRKNEEILLIREEDDPFSTVIEEVLAPNVIKTRVIPSGSVIKVKRIIEKSVLNSNESAYTQSTYLSYKDDTVLVTSSGLPRNLDSERLNRYEFNLVSVNLTGTTYLTKDSNNLSTSIDPNTSVVHYLISGEKVYLETEYEGIESGYYFIRVRTNNRVSLFKSTGDLILSYSTDEQKRERAVPLTVPSPGILLGKITIFRFKDLENQYKNQLLLKEFEVQKSARRNLRTSGNQINNIKDAYESNAL
jgi:hypothetical protein